VFIVVIRDPDAVRRPAARPFVQDAQSAVRRTYRQSHGTLDVANESRSSRSTDSVGSRITAINTIVISYESSASGAVI